MNGVRPVFCSCFKTNICGFVPDSESNSDAVNLGKREDEAGTSSIISDSEVSFSDRTNKPDMSKSTLVEAVRKTVTFEATDGNIIKDSIPAYANVNSTSNDCDKKDVIKNSLPGPEVRYGRAVSQPGEFEEMMMARFRIGGFSDECHDHGSSIPSASARRTQRNGRRRNNHTLYGVSPHCKFGPKGYLVSSTACTLTIPDPSNQKLNWTKPPLTVLIIRKHLDETVLAPFRDLVIWLMEEKKMVVYVEKMVLAERLLLDDGRFQLIKSRLKTFVEGVDNLTDKVDFIICLGGDGTLLYVSSLFQDSVPPVMAFNMGSLGFLTPFQFYKDFKNEVTRVMQGSASLLLRFRLKCVVIKHDTASVAEIPHVKKIQKEHVYLKTHKLVLNEVVIDRGPSSYLSNLDLYIEGRKVTSVQGDGLIISTPTGSTAYAVAAGASMIHPSVPCILITPICPHSLSFRPIVVPAGVEIKVMVSPSARGTAMVSFDGRDRQEIHQGDSLRITTASYPVPSICAADQIEDWFDGLSVCLNWNQRLIQQPLQVSSSATSIESLDSESPVPSTPHTPPLSNGSTDKQTNSRDC